MCILAAKLFILSALVAGCNRIEENELHTYCCSVSAQLFSTLREIKGSTERHGEEAAKWKKKKNQFKVDCGKRAFKGRYANKLTE